MYDIRYKVSLDQIMYQRILQLAKFDSPNEVVLRILDVGNVTSKRTYFTLILFLEFGTLGPLVA